MKIIVCGGRDFEDEAYVFGVLDAYLALQGRAVHLIAHGGARGADNLADKWATVRGIKVKQFPVPKREWDLYGKAAGPIRNKRMLEEVGPDVVIAFPGGSGTADMVKRSLSKGVEVLSLPGVVGGKIPKLLIGPSNTF
jgi:YspA, cpYpsA-related SLOG family